MLTSREQVSLKYLTLIGAEEVKIHPEESINFPKTSMERGTITNTLQILLFLVMEAPGLEDHEDNKVSLF